jgi:hypothetical protein
MASLGLPDCFLLFLGRSVRETTSRWRDVRARIPIDGALTAMQASFWGIAVRSLS